MSNAIVSVGEDDYRVVIFINACLKIKISACRSLLRSGMKQSVLSSQISLSLSLSLIFLLIVSLSLTRIWIVVPIRSDVAVAVLISRLIVRLFRHHSVGPS